MAHAGSMRRTSTPWRSLRRELSTLHLTSIWAHYSALPFLARHAVSLRQDSGIGDLILPDYRVKNPFLRFCGLHRTLYWPSLITLLML